MNTYSCKYHPDRNAVTKCEKCGAMVCLECKNVYQHHYHSSHHHHSYSTRYELCPECYATKVNQSYNPICLCFPVVFLLFFMGIASSMFSQASSWGMGPPTGFAAMFFLVPILMLGILGYTYFVQGPKAKAEANRRRDTALGGLHGTEYAPSRSTQTGNYAPRSRQRYCQKCGEPFDPLSSFCSNCGTSTRD